MNQIVKDTLVSLLFLVSVSAVAQDPLSEFGHVTIDEFRKPPFTADTTSAVILFDKGVVNPGILKATYRFTRHVRIKVFTRQGLSWANTTIRIPRVGLDITDIQGVTYNLEDGVIKESKMNPDAVFKTRFDRDIDEIKFALPKVVEGSIFEFSYVLRGTLVPVNWQFQYTIPVLRSQFEANVPLIFRREIEMQGYFPLKTNVENKERSHKLLGMDSIPAFTKEPFMNTMENYISKVHFYSIRFSWIPVIRGSLAMPLFGKQITGSDFLKEKVIELTEHVSGLENRMQVVYDYVKANISWDGTTDRIPDHLFKKVFEAKKGSSSEINLILLCMLQKAGLVVEPVFISTRNHGIVRQEVIEAGQFNDVICLVKIGDKKLLLDATDKDLPLSTLPERCLNGEGLICSEKEPIWIDIKSSKSREVFDCDLVLDESGILKGKLNITRDGLAGGKARKLYRDMGEEKYTEMLFAKKDWKMKGGVLNNMTAPVAPVKETYEIEIREEAKAIGSIIYINPIVTERIEQNIFRQGIRKYPVDLPSPFEKLFVAKLVIPDNYVIEEIPSPKLISLPKNGGKFAYSVTQSGNTINIISQLLINKEFFLPEEYPYLRELYNQVVANQAEQIVLRKK